MLIVQVKDSVKLGIRTYTDLNLNKLLIVKSLKKYSTYLRKKKIQAEIHYVIYFQTAERSGYNGYLLGDGIPTNGEAFGFGIAFPGEPITGDFFLRNDFFPNRLFRYDGARWVKQEDNVRMTLTNTDTRATQKTTFVNNTNTDTIGGVTTTERQSLSQALRPKADN